MHVVVTGCECAKEPRHGDVLRSSGGKNPPLLDIIRIFDDAVTSTNVVMVTMKEDEIGGT